MNTFCIIMWISKPRPFRRYSLYTPAKHEQNTWNKNWPCYNYKQETLKVGDMLEFLKLDSIIWPWQAKWHMKVKVVLGDVTTSVLSKLKPNIPIKNKMMAIWDKFNTCFVVWPLRSRSNSVWSRSRSSCWVVFFKSEVNILFNNKVT